MGFRKKVLNWLIWFTQIFGLSLRDAKGLTLCRAFPFWWRGKLHLLGLPNYVHLRPVPLAEECLTYWRQTISWEQAGPPNFPRLGKMAPDACAPVVCHVIICHLSPAQAQAVVERWRTVEPESIQLLAYGGTKADYDRLPPDLNAIYIAEDSLRTNNHARERQQYSGIFKSASHWLAQNDVAATHVHLAEFDVIPLVDHPGLLLVRSLQEEDADVLGFGLVDLTGTTHPHYRHEMSGAKLLEYLNGASMRELRTRLIAMLGCSSIWTRECFDAVAQLDTPRVYLEVAMPTLAHHLGYRVRPMPEAQQRFVTFQGDYTSRIEEYRQKGAWLVHPCKLYWRFYPD